VKHGKSLFLCCNLFLGKTVNCMNAIYPCWKGPMTCYFEFLILERAVIFLNEIYPCRKGSHVVTVCLNKSRFCICRVYISYVMLTIALRVKCITILAISFYLFKIDYFCHEIILNSLELWFIFLKSVIFLVTVVILHHFRN
jgi:hypothetical protein